MAVDKVAKVAKAVEGMVGAAVQPSENKLWRACMQGMRAVRGKVEKPLE